MEYVQTVLVQIEPSKIDRASGLLAELDEHRDYLHQQPGFRDIRVSRSINPEGNVLLMIETRWENDDALVEYETREPNVQSIVGGHTELIVPDSLQALDMEALRATEPGKRHMEPAAEAFDRLAMPILIPVGVLAFTLLVVYGLSRIYLEVDPGVAVGLAAAIVFGILLVSAYVASRPSIPGWQIGAIAFVAAATLTGGTIFALVEEDEGEAHEEPTPTATATEEPGDGDGAPGGALVVDMGDNFFVFEGEENPTIPVPAGEEVTISLTNSGQAIHNMRIAGVDNEYNTDDDFASEPGIISGGDTGEIVFQIDEPGTYPFRCDFHPIDMIGEIEAQ